MLSEEHIEKILRFYECIKHDPRQHRGEYFLKTFTERETSNFSRARQALRDRSWDLLQMQHCSARKREREREMREKESGGARKVTSDCRLQVSI